MFRIIYISGETLRFTSDQLRSLLEESRIKNARLGITGLLLYKHGNFMQVIEGGEKEVKELFESICNDSRHRRVIPVVQESIQERDFPRWSMAFREMDPDRDEVPPAFSGLLHRSWSDLDLEIPSDTIRSFVRVFIAATS